MSVNHPDIKVVCTVTAIECRGTEIQLDCNADGAYHVGLPAFLPAEAVNDLIECLYTALNVIADRNKQ